MTNEQRKAIEICKEKIIEPFYDFPNPTSIELKDTDVEAIEIVLSLIKEQDKYIKDANDITTEMSNDIKKLTSEIEKKDKQIDELVKYIDSNNYVDNEECQFQWDFEIKKCIGNGDCKECIKQYFETKAKKGE